MDVCMVEESAFEKTGPAKVGATGTAHGFSTVADRVRGWTQHTRFILDDCLRSAFAVSADPYLPRLAE